MLALDPEPVAKTGSEPLGFKTGPVPWHSAELARQTNEQHAPLFLPQWLGKNMYIQYIYIGYIGLCFVGFHVGARLQS